MIPLEYFTLLDLKHKLTFGDYQRLGLTSLNRLRDEIDERMGEIEERERVKKAQEAKHD